jgi:hypothetical protein
MIRHDELKNYLENNMPELGLDRANTCRTIYDIARRLFEYTRDQVLNRKMRSARHCLALVEQLYKTGDALVKNAIENVYVYSFSKGFFCDSRDRKQLMKIVPVTLFQLYKKQMLNHL